jgi:hypothetical protein
MKSESGLLMTLGNAAAARVRLIVWCKACQHQAEPIGRFCQRSLFVPRSLNGTAPCSRKRSGLRRQRGWRAELGCPAELRWDGQRALFRQEAVGFIVNRSTDTDLLKFLDANVVFYLDHG